MQPFITVKTRFMQPKPDDSFVNIFPFCSANESTLRSCLDAGDKVQSEHESRVALPT